MSPQSRVADELAPELLVVRESPEVVLARLEAIVAKRRAADGPAEPAEVVRRTKRTTKRKSGWSTFFGFYACLAMLIGGCAVALALFQNWTNAAATGAWLGLAAAATLMRTRRTLVAVTSFWV